MRVCSWSRTDSGPVVRTDGPASRREGRGGFRVGRAVVFFFPAVKNNGVRTLDKFSAGSNALTMCRIHKIYGHSCQGHGDSSTEDIISRGDVVLSVAMLKDACSPRSPGRLSCKS